MQTQHTPGPWHVFQPSGGHLFINAGLARVARIEDQKLPAEEAKANAQLIAAAPELLAALQEIQSRLEAMQQCNGWKYWEQRGDTPNVLEWVAGPVVNSLESARAAITKATGKEQA